MEGSAAEHWSFLEGILESNRVKSLLVLLGADGSKWDTWEHLGDNTGMGHRAALHTA